MLEEPSNGLSIDFVGPKPSIDDDKYLLVIIDECSRYPFVYPCPDVPTRRVRQCLQNLFSILCAPKAIHSDRGAQFKSKEFREILWSHGTVITHTTAYYPNSNGQCEILNGVIWKTILLPLRSGDLPERSPDLQVNNYEIHLLI
ncbi:hypothetical protein GJ496_005661 [Pomphorhynchus laevis]|nr:hypothetical protein GJ496_005661 [Pomphorhynchus laevis]